MNKKNATLASLKMKLIEPKVCFLKARKKVEFTTQRMEIIWKNVKN